MSVKVSGTSNLEKQEKEEARLKEELENSMFDEEGRHKKMPWLTYSTMEYSPENGYCFIEHFKSLDTKLNEKVSESDYYNGVRYLKIRLMKNMDANRYNQIKPLSENSSKVRAYRRILDSDIIELDLTQSEYEKGYRYIKINMPTNKLENGWLTFSELEDGWNVSTSKIATRVSENKKRKFRKRQNQNKMMDEVKKYISVE